ncbi:MAG: hypothetical protein IH626_02545 [Rhodospirillales bacterium]|nr:hypothetical protein [Rhodospirillales bacterium]
MADQRRAQHLSYVSSLRLLADESLRQLAALMPHYGERGRIAEEIIKSALERVLPKRFSIGNGVIVSSKGQVSEQIDIVIYDNFFNSPIPSAFGPSVFPVESVYASIEVKATLTPKELDASLEDIKGLREIGSRKHVVISRYEDVGGSKKVVSEKRISTVPPRSYVVAFRQRGLGRSYEDFVGALGASLDKVDTHVHGVCVLSTDWFAARKPMSSPAVVVGQEGEALLNLYLSILRGQQNFAVYPMDVEAYLENSE